MFILYYVSAGSMGRIIKLDVVGSRGRVKAGTRTG